MSIPAETPAAVTYFPSTTTRSSLGSTPYAARSARANQWLVARRPASRPAEASTNDPVQTDVVQLVWRSASSSHSCSSLPARWSRCPSPPGITQHIRLGDLGYVVSTCNPSIPVSVRTTVFSAPVMCTVAPGIRLSTS